MEIFNMTAPCLFGLESVLSGELKRIDAINVSASDGRVSFSGDENLIARANICLRTAERVMIVLKTFKAATFDELFEQTKSIEFERFISKKNAFPVTGWSLNSKLHSVPDCQSIIKKAAVERLKQKYNVSWFEETEAPVQIRFSIKKDIVSIMLDTSGAGLHKRGYRKESTIAPIKETLASGILDLARIYPDTVLYDPFCGSGTFSIEAAMKALNIPSGIGRRFACEKWGSIKDRAFSEERSRALSGIRKNTEFKAYMSDIDERAVALALDNAKKAKVDKKISAQVKDINDFICSDERALVVCNPPYGERLLDIRQAEEIYKIMGKRFERREGMKYYIISPHEDFERFFGRPADKKRKLYNGNIKCFLYMYFK